MTQTELLKMIGSGAVRDLDLTGRELKNIDFKGCRVENVTFDECTLTECNFDGCGMERVSFRKAALRSAARWWTCSTSSRRRSASCSRVSSASSSATRYAISKAVFTLRQYLTTLADTHGLTRTLGEIEVCRDGKGRICYSAGNSAVVFRIRCEGRVRSLRCYMHHPRHLAEIYGEKLLPQELFIYTSPAGGVWVATRRG